MLRQRPPSAANKGSYPTPANARSCCVAGIKVGRMACQGLLAEDINIQNIFQLVKAGQGSWGTDSSASLRRSCGAGKWKRWEPYSYPETGHAPGSSSLNSLKGTSS